MPWMAIAGTIAGGLSGAAGSANKDIEWYGPPQGDKSEMETRGRDMVGNQLTGIEGLFKQGPGQEDYTAGVQGQRELADMFKEMSTRSLDPTQDDITKSYGLAGQLMAPERVSMEQAWRKQSTDVDRMAAQMGRSTADPILQAKLRQGQMDQEAQFQARQGSMGSQMAWQRPRDAMQQQMNMSMARANVLSGLGTQALQNKMTLLGLGSQIEAAERNARVQQQQMMKAREVNSLEHRFASSLAGSVAGMGSGLGMSSMFGGGQQGGGMLSGMSSASSLQAPAIGTSYAQTLNQPVGFNMASQLGPSQLPQSYSDMYKVPSSSSLGTSFGSSYTQSLK